MQTSELGYDPKDMQSVFDFIVRHLFKQGKRAIGKYGCAYRVPDTNFKCAIGCLIPDDLYVKDIEGCSVRSIYEPRRSTSADKLIEILQEIGFSVGSGIGKESFMDSFLRNMQAIHDNYVSWDNEVGPLSECGISSLQTVCNKFGLKDTVLIELERS
jgi:hypothetical protein